MNSLKHLYVAGGSHRSARTAGMLSAIEESGQTHSFHYYIGQSSGSFSLMFLLGGVARNRAMGYWKSLPQTFANKKFIDKKQALLFGGVMDLNYFVNVFLEKDNPIPWHKVLMSKENQEGRLLIQAVDTDTGRAIFLSSFKTVWALKQSIIASSWIPYIAGFYPYTIHSHELSDMVVLDEQFNPLNKNRVRTYDGQLVDSFFIQSIKHNMADEHTVLVNTHTKHAHYLSKNAFGYRLKWLERLLSYILFYGRMAAQKLYAYHVINGGFLTEFNKIKKLSKENKSINLVTPSVYVPLDLIESHSMKQAVQSGWDGWYLAFKKEKQPYPNQWDE